MQAGGVLDKGSRTNGVEEFHWCMRPKRKNGSPQAWDITRGGKARGHGTRPRQSERRREAMYKLQAFWGSKG